MLKKLLAGVITAVLSLGAQPLVIVSEFRAGGTGDDARTRRVAATATGKMYLLDTATGVLVFMTSGALAVTLSVWKRSLRQRLAFTAQEGQENA